MDGVTLREGNLSAEECERSSWETAKKNVFDKKSVQLGP